MLPGPTGRAGYRRRRRASRRVPATRQPLAVVRVLALLRLPSREASAPIETAPAARRPGMTASDWALRGRSPSPPAAVDRDRGTSNSPRRQAGIARCRRPPERGRCVVQRTRATSWRVPAVRRRPSALCASAGRAGGKMGNSGGIRRQVGLCGNRLAIIHSARHARDGPVTMARAGGSRRRQTVYQTRSETTCLAVARIRCSRCSTPRF